MTRRAIDPESDLTVQRVIRAPRHDVWRAWTGGTLLQRWWVPARTVACVDVLDAYPGGGFVTRMSDNGRDFVPHTDGIFVVVENDRRLVSPMKIAAMGSNAGGVPYLDDDFVRRASAWLDLADGPLPGRRTYEAFARDWPQIAEPDPFAARRNVLPSSW